LVAKIKECYISKYELYLANIQLISIGVKFYTTIIFTL